jgi:hypothetical protein
VSERERLASKLSQERQSRVNFAGGTHPGNGTGVVGEEGDNEACGLGWMGGQQLDGEPDVDNDSEKFEGVGMEARRDEVGWFASIINSSHVEADFEESVSHHSPHDVEFGGPAAEAAMGGVG